MLSTGVQKHTQCSVQDLTSPSTDSPTHPQHLDPHLPGNGRKIQSAPRTQWVNAFLRGKVLLNHGPSDILNPGSREEIVKALKMWETT